MSRKAEGSRTSYKCRDLWAQLLQLSKRRGCKYPVA